MSLTSEREKLGRVQLDNRIKMYLSCSGAAAAAPYFCTMNPDKTLLVITASKFVERFSSAALSLLLDIDLKNSKTLSSKSSALTFKQKLDLLTDINAFDKKDLAKFQTFTEVRNQFAHNFDVDDFETCFSFITGAENYMKKQYPEVTETGKSHEDYLITLFRTLFIDIINICGGIIETIESKTRKESRTSVNDEIYNELIDTIKSYADKNPEFTNFYHKTVEAIGSKKK